MCGIAGKLYFNQELNPQQAQTEIKEALGLLKHRGPDDCGYYLDKKIWLASTRLSIIDLSAAGRMPMSNEQKNLWLVFNGEIYNYKELRQKLGKKHRFISQTDSEVVVHLYEDYGVDCLKYLRGMFAFAIWDKIQNRLFIARDRLGKKPIKYYYNSSFFVFASELKAFINQSGVPREIDYQAVDQYLSMEYIPSPKTGFKNIFKLPPASYILVDSHGRITSKKYWNLDFSQKLKMKEEEWEERLTEKLTESVKIRLRSDVPLGVHLSGGVDSSLITAIACRVSKKRLSSFSVGFEDDEFNELPYAKKVAQAYRTDHHEIILKPQSLHNLERLCYAYEEPFADPSILPTWSLMEQSRKKVTVALNGDGGDENFGGYERYRMMAMFQLVRFLPLKKQGEYVLSLLSKRINNSTLKKVAKVLNYYNTNYFLFYTNLINASKPDLIGALYSKDFKEKIRYGNSGNFLTERYREIPVELSWLDKLLSLDVETYLADNLMPKVDIASMAFSLEVRSPFLDYELMELTAKMPSSLKVSPFQTKQILKKIAEKYLPKECIYRKKQGFVPPMENWLRSDFEYLKEQLTGDEFNRWRIFDRENVGDLLDQFKQNQKNARILWRLLYLKQWLSVWFGK